MEYLTFDDKTWAVDIEADGLRPTVVWCLCASNMISGEKIEITDMDEMRDWIMEKKALGHKFVFHNGLHFDGPVLNDLCGTLLSSKCIVDTMVLSMLWNPSLPGKHNLEAWGERAKIPKLEYDDWESGLTPEMLERCHGDVRITKWVYSYLCRKLRGINFSEEACELEHNAWVLVRAQKLNGFAFDYARAVALRSDLIDIANELYERLQVFFPPKLEMVKEYKQARKQDGTHTKGFIENKERYAKLVEYDDGTYEAWDYVPFDPASPPQRVERLLEAGWVPQEFTPPSDTFPEGQPQPTRKGKLAPSLVAFVETLPEDNGIVCLVDWMEANGRASIIKTWMDNYNDDTGCIHGTLWLANTLRYKHSGPNTANAPGVKVGEEKDADGKVVKTWVKMGKAGGWAYECRDLWTTRDRAKRRMVGVDAKGIQLRVLAHYLDDENFTAAILSEDPHAANARMMDLPGRGIAKTITYAIVMGAGDQRIATESRTSLADAKKNKEKFFEKVPGLKDLIKRLKAERKKDGRITLCSGARILCEQDHTVIPYLLQGDESCIMKKAKQYAQAMIRKRGLDVLWAGDIHDEWQADVLLEDVDEFIEVCKIAFRKAGEFYAYRLPIDCDAKVGFTWAETH